MEFWIIDLRKVDSSSGARMNDDSKKLNQIHDLAAAGLILRILDEEELSRRNNFIVAMDGRRVGISDARNLMVSIVNGMVEIS